ncbi:hypothetical protein Vafri_15117, partial [Volvox africanus]
WDEAPDDEDGAVPQETCVEVVEEADEEASPPASRSSANRAEMTPARISTRRGRTVPPAGDAAHGGSVTVDGTARWLMAFAAAALVRSPPTTRGGEQGHVRIRERGVNRLMLEFAKRRAARIRTE